MKIYIILNENYKISILRSVVNNKDVVYFNNINMAYNYIIEHGLPRIFIYEYNEENKNIISLSENYFEPLFYSIVLFNNFNETLIKNHLQNYYGDFFILSNNIKELGLHINQFIINKKYKQKNNKDIYFDELNNTISDGISIIKLTRLEYNLFRFLYLKANHVVTRKEIQLAVYGFDEYDIFSRSIDTHIKLIRKKINKLPSFKYQIITSRGKGYSLTINNTELTLNGVSKTNNCCGTNLKIDYTISCSYQDNKCLNTTICKECSLTYLIPNNCCNCNINPCVMFDCLDVEQIANNMILVRAKCNIKY